MSATVTKTANGHDCCPALADAGLDPHTNIGMHRLTEFKHRHPGCVLLYRWRGSWWSFGEDARIMRFTLGRAASDQLIESVEVAAAGHLLERLVAAGHRVAVVERFQEAPSGATVERVVVGVAGE